MEQKSFVRYGLLAVVALQIALIMVIVVPKERTLATGTTVILQTAPVDPRDLFRGDYVVLSYEISAVTANDPLPYGDTVYVELEERDGVWHSTGASGSKPNGLFIKGKIVGGGAQVGARLSVEYGIETYFVPEGSGYIIERGQNVTVKVAINGAGTAAIKEVLIDGRPFDPDKPQPTFIR